MNYNKLRNAKYYFENNMKKFNLEEFFIENGVSKEKANMWAHAYMQVLPKYKINTPLRLSAFFANVFHESGYFTRLQENLNYSAERLAAVWPHRYSVEGRGRKLTPNDLAKKIARKPELIANYTYANRMGNGTPKSGDGWRYRGMGPIQLTGKNNARKVTHATGLDVLNHPECQIHPEGGSVTSCWYWDAVKANYYADRNDFDGCRDLANIGRKTAKYGDAIGFKDSNALFEKLKTWFSKNPCEIDF